MEEAQLASNRQGVFFRNTLLGSIQGQVLALYHLRRYSGHQNVPRASGRRPWPDYSSQSQLRSLKGQNHGPAQAVLTGSIFGRCPAFFVTRAV